MSIFGPETKNYFPLVPWLLPPAVVSQLQIPSAAHDE